MSRGLYIADATDGKIENFYRDIQRNCNIFGILNMYENCSACAILFTFAGKSVFAA